ncbi:DNA-protecting protein DprA, partial [bacterium]|nr:DNA-protecting protein DprA [bacterium]
DPRLPWLQLAAISWIGDTVKSGLIKEFGSPEAVFRSSQSQLSRVKGWTPARLERFLREGKNTPPICNPETLDEKGIELVKFSDPEYPLLLRQIPDSPVVLFSMGKSIPDNRPHFSIVGARQATQTGYDIAQEFSSALSKAGFVIVSGLALGIDTFAHKGALDAHGRTIAILGCGSDVIYPSGNRKIREKILENGELLSEYPPGMLARPWHFPVRNRIISGMSVGTLVIEATARSGSLITARLAGEQNRDVFALPGNIRSKLSQGTLALINDGAELVTSPQAIIDQYPHLIPEKEDSDLIADFELTSDEAKLVETLSDDPVSLDKLLAQGKWSRDKLFNMLLNLELRDILVKFPGNLFQAKIKSPSGRESHVKI